MMFVESVRAVTRRSGSGRGRPILVGLVLMGLGAAVGCSGLAEGNYRLTGETRVYQADQGIEPFALVGYGALHLPHDVVIAGDGRSGRFSRGGQRSEVSSVLTPELYHALDKEDPQEQRICIVLNRCFIKYLQELGKPEVLAYVEVADGVGSRPIKNVFFRDDYQPAGALLNFQDAVIYGPTTFSGKPITIRVYVYELDREDNKIASAVVDAVAGAAKTFGGPFGLAADVVGDVIKALIATNVDDREFYHEVTLYPSPKGAKYAPGNVMALRTGTYVVVKKEVQRLFADAESVMEFKDELDVDLGLGAWPNILCRSGELYRHERLGALYRELEKLTGKEIEAELRRYSTARRRASGGKDSAPGPGQVDRALGEIVRENVSKARRLAAPETVFLDDANKLAGLEEQTSQVDFRQYAPYRGKSYLTFSVVNHLSPADPQLLNEVYTSGAREVEETLNARLDTDALAARILEVQAKASRAIVEIVASRKLKRVGAEDRQAMKEALLVMYPDQQGAIEDAYRRLEAEATVEDLTHPYEKRLRDVLTGRVCALEKAADIDEQKLTDLQDAIQRLMPELWPSVKPFVDGTRLMREVSELLGPCGPTCDGE